MAKEPKKVVKKDDTMNGAMRFFLAGCVAELYLLIINRFYINSGSDLKRIAWYDTYLWVLAGIGGAVLVVGLIAALALRKTHRSKPMWLAAAAGAFVAAATLLVRWNMSTLSLMTVLVPVITLLGVLWGLYDRECALALTVLGLSLVALFGLRRYGSSMYIGTAVKACVAVYAVLVLVVALLARGDKLGKLLPAKADRLPVYVGCGLSVASLAAALLVSGASYYVTWVLAIVVFALAVYYTVKQL